MRSPVPEVPNSLTSPCPKLPMPDGNGLDDMVRVIIEVADLYHECSDKQRALSEIVKED